MRGIPENGISEGDKVEVFWEHIERIQGVVDYIPCDTGDSWHIVDATGTVHYVQTYGRMTKLNPK